MLTVPPAVPRLPIPILELIINDLAAEVSRLGRILAALRSEVAPSSKLSEIISAAPAATVAGKPGVFAAWIETLPDRCIHGLRRNCLHCDGLTHVEHLYLPTRLAEGAKIWTPEHGVTFYGRPCRFKEFAVRPLRMELKPKPNPRGEIWPCRYDPRLDDRDDLEPTVDESFDCSHRRFRTSTCVILPVERFCLACEASKPKREEVSKVKTLTQPKIDRRPMPKPDVPLPGDISFLPLSLEQCEAAKAKRVMLPGLRNGRSIRVREAWEIAAYNAEWTAKNNRKLAARGWLYSPEQFDRAILYDRKKRGAVELGK